MTDRRDPAADTEPLEHELRDLLHDRATVDSGQLERVRGTAATLPARRPRFGALLARAAVVVVVVALGLGVFALIRLPSGPGIADGPRLQDPSAFAGDPRLAVCPADDAIYAFELERLAEFRAYYGGENFPTDEIPALVVVSGSRVGTDRTRGDYVLAPGHYGVCIAAGAAGGGSTIGPIAVTDADLTALLPAFDMIGDPVRYFADPRYERCGGLQADVIGAFEMAHARDYRRHVPAMGESPELEVDEPAFVVVFRGPHPFGLSGPPASPDPLADLLARDLCILVGSDAATAVLNVYPGVDPTGLLVHLDVPDGPTAAATPTAPPSDPADWGPLAVFDSVQGSTLQANAGPGTLRIGERCVTLAQQGDQGEVPTTVIWGADEAVWDPEAREILYTTDAGDHLRLADGVHVSISGGDGHLQASRLIRPVDPSCPSDWFAANDIRLAPEMPPWTDDLAGQLGCDGPIRTIGGELGEVSEQLLGPTLADLAEYLERTNFDSLPGRFDLTNSETHWVRYIHESLGRTKVVLVATDTRPDWPGMWIITALRSCDPSEFDRAAGLAGAYLSIWQSSGKPVSTETIHEIRGPGHCGWESTIWLRYEGVQFVRDPEGVLAELTVAPFLTDVELPLATATDTGLYQGGRHLWRSVDGRYVYLVTGDIVEAWPRARQELGCS